MKVEWKQALLVAGGAAAAGVAMYYLLRDENTELKEGESDGKKINRHDATKEQVLEVLKDILGSQEKMKVLMKNFTQEFYSKEYNFEEAYKLVSLEHPDDPLERYGLTMADFDALLDKYQHEPSIKDLVLTIMGTATPSVPTQKAYTISTALIIQLHEFMLEELQSLVNIIQSSNIGISIDMKTVTLAAQAFVGAKVQKKFDLTSEDIESAVMLNHKELACSPEFARVNVSIQSIMNRLIGSEL